MLFGTAQVVTLAIFLAVYALIVVRKVGKFKVELWMAMLLGAMTFLGFGLTTLPDAFAAVNADVILFLFGAFLIVEVMIQTGLLQYIAIRFIRTARTPARLLLLVIVFVSFASAFLVNDAVVLVMTPIVIASCTLAKVRKMPYLLGVALSSNIGSALTPIGNPQNVLIKIESGIGTVGFMGKMALPVILGMAAEYFILKTIYRKDLRGNLQYDMMEPEKMLTSRFRAYAVGAIAVLVIIGFLASDFTGWPIALTAAIGGTAALLMSMDRRQAIKGIDWGTLVFFASMFVVMDTVSRNGLLQALIEPFASSLFAPGASSVLSIFGLSLAVSQVTSNVPFVAIMLPVFHGAGATGSQWLSLAAGSTLAGNLTLLGAAANVIVLEAAESRGETFSFMEFLKAGVPTTFATCAIAIAFLILLA
jgi:Na+/H+ antiporter NhaD/arsenite permease-like protein